jgi:RNA polymerase sigma-70 factor, ECF subfamily
MAIAGDATRLDQFTTLYAERSGTIYAMMLRLSRTSATAEDLTQETFLRAWRALPSFRGESTSHTWLHAIALHVWIDWCRQQRRDFLRWRGPDELRYTDAIVAAMPDTGVELELSIARLPRQMGEAVILYYIHGYSVKDVANALGKAEGTIKAQLHAARKLLREEWS